MSSLTRRDFLAATAGLAALGASPQDPPAKFVVHEWGVVTVPLGTTGATLRSAGASFAGGKELEVGLPAFVPTWTKVVGEEIKEWKKTPRPVSKPVVHFYAPSPMTVRLGVKFPTGRPHAWWPPTPDYGPRPQEKALDRFEFDIEELHEIKPINGHLKWAELKVGGDGAPPAAEGWWAAARKTDASMVRAGDAAERFVFYDGLCTFDPKLDVEWTGDESVAVVNRTGAATGGVLAIVVAGGKCASSQVAAIGKDGRSTLALKAGEPDVEAFLRAAGLYEKEAAAVAAIWRDEFVRADGARVVAVLPRVVVDTLLPLEIVPEPAELVRVLLAQVEGLNAAKRAELDGWIAKLALEDLEERDEAMARIREFGPFAEVHLRRALAAATDPQRRAAIEELLKTKGP